MEKFNEEYFKNYGIEKRPYGWNQWHTIHTIQFKQLFNPKRVLDVGCARGAYLSGWRQIGIEAEGIDISEWAVKNPCDKRLKLSQGDITKGLPYPDKSFDLVTCFDVLEHLTEEDIHKAIKELRRISSKWVVISTLFKDVERHRDMFYADPTHLTFRTKQWWFDHLECDKYGYAVMPYETLEPFLLTTPLIDQLIVTGVERNDG